MRYSNVIMFALSPLLGQICSKCWIPDAALSREIKNLQEAEADLLRKKEVGAEANQAAMDIIPTAQHILDNYDILTTEEKNRLWKLVLKKATLYRTPAGELSVHIYPRLPK